MGQHNGRRFVPLTTLVAQLNYTIFAVYGCLTVADFREPTCITHLTKSSGDYNHDSISGSH